MLVVNRRGRPMSPLPKTGDDFLRRLASRMRMARLQLGLTQTDMAERSGGALTQVDWKNYESGKSEPMLRRFLGVCKAIGVTPDEFLESM